MCRPIRPWPSGDRDRISAFDCIWQVDGLNGVPGRRGAQCHRPATGSKLFKEAGDWRTATSWTSCTPSSGSCKAPSRDDRGHVRPPVHHQLHVACLGWCEREFCSFPAGRTPEAIRSCRDPHHPSTKGILKGAGRCRKRTTSTSPAATSAPPSGLGSPPADIDRYEALLGMVSASSARRWLPWIRVFVDTSVRIRLRDRCRRSREAHLHG